MALGLLPILVLSLFFLFTRGLRLQRQADDVTRAAELARLQLESIRQMSWSKIPAAAVFDGRAGAARNSDGFPPAPYPSLQEDAQTYWLRVETASDGSSRAVKVQVSWPGDHQTMLETLINP